MESIICKHTFNFGKIALYGTRRINAVDVTLELRKCGGKETFRVENGERIYTGEKTPEYVELSICGNVWNSTHTDVISAGQNLETIKNGIFKRTSLGAIMIPVPFMTLYRWWKEFHLNGMHAGTPEQEAALREFHKDGSRYDYTADCEYLKSIGLYEVEYTGKSVGRMYDHEPYKYGHAWLVQDIPEETIREIMELVNKKERRI